MAAERGEGGGGVDSKCCSVGDGAFFGGVCVGGGGLRWGGATAVVASNGLDLSSNKFDGPWPTWLLKEVRGDQGSGVVGWMVHE
jgi:hypothetical protein